MSGSRTLVLLTLVCWAVLISPFPRSLHGAGIAIVIVLIVLDAALGETTGWLAFARPSRLDEREAALRDWAYRRAFRLIVAGLLLMVLANGVGGAIRSSAGSQPPALPVPDLGARDIVAFLELLVILPTAVIAWWQPAPDASGLRERIRSHRGRWMVPAAAIPIVAALWLLAVAALPTRSAGVSQVPSTSFAAGDARCGEFSAIREVGYGFGGSVRLRAGVCWDGRQAWVFGDPALSRPASMPPEEFVASFPSLTSCAIDDGAADFATVADQRCMESFDANGTMHYLVRGRVSPGVGRLGARDLEIDLTVTRDGRILSFG